MAPRSILAGPRLVLDAEQRRQMASVYDGEQSNREASDDPAVDERLIQESHARAIRDVAEHFGCSEEDAAEAVSWYGV
jgi:hypothetical protein